MIPENKNLNFITKLKQFTDVRVLSLLAFGAIAVLITWSGLKVAKTNYELEKQISQLEQRNSVEELENENLRLRNEYYKSDQYLELAARNKFNKAAPGEKLYLIPKEVELGNTLKSPIEGEKQKAERQTDQKSKYLRNFDAWMEFLFHSGSST
jgi:cell division protein FtsB